MTKPGRSRLINFQEYFLIGGLFEKDLPGFLSIFFCEWKCWFWLKILK